MWTLAATVPKDEFDIPGMLGLACALYASGAVILVLGAGTFRAAQTTVAPRTPAKASRVVTHGIDRLSRNHMYLGSSTIQLGAAVHIENACTFLVLMLFVLYLTRLQLIPEERTTRTLFPGEYATYVAHVRRWL